jgi:hypothetical protein
MVYPCETESNSPRVIFATIFEGMQLGHYVLFIWLNMWYKVYIAARRASELDELCEKEPDDQSNSGEPSLEFMTGVNTVNRQATNRRCRFRCWFYIMLSITILLDLFAFVVLSALQTNEVDELKLSHKYVLQLSVWVFTSLDTLISLPPAVTTLSAFCKLRSILGRKNDGNVNKLQISLYTLLSFLYVGTLICKMPLFALFVDNPLWLECLGNFLEVTYNMAMLLFCWRLLTPLPENQPIDQEDYD